MTTLTPSDTIPNSYSLNWNAQQSHILEGLRDLVNGHDDLLVADVTLACDGEYVQAHKLILSLCSSFFKDLFQKNRADKSNAIVILGNNVSAQDLCYLLQFMYVGRVDIPSEDLNSFLKAGNALKVEGLIRNAKDNFQKPPVSDESPTPTTSRVNFNGPSHSEPKPGPSRSRSSRSFAPAWSEAGPSTKAMSSSSSDRSQSKKRRLSETELSTSDPDGSDTLLPPKIVSTVSCNMERSSADPLDLGGTEGAQFNSGEMVADIEEHFNPPNNIKSEPIPIFNGCEESGHSEEFVDKDTFEDLLGDNTYELPPLEGNVSVRLSAPVSVSVSQGSASSPSVGSHVSEEKRRGSSLNSRKRGKSYSSFTLPGKSSRVVRKTRGSETGCRPNDQDSKPRIWDYFEFTSIGKKQGNLTTSKIYRCKVCENLFKSSGYSTSNLWSHLRHVHPSALN